MSTFKARPYCCTGEEWKDANYGVKMDGIPFTVYSSFERAVKACEVLKKRHPGAHWTISNKTKGVY